MSRSTGSGDLVPRTMRSGQLKSSTAQPSVRKSGCETTVRGQPAANQAAEFLVQGVDLELANTGTNPGHLRTLAEATGGVYLEVGQAAQLPDRIARTERRTARTLRTEYWNSPWLFGAFLLAISGEWFLRRKNHLV